MRSLSSRRSQLLTRIKTSERKTWEGVKPLRPVAGFFRPRSRSLRTFSMIDSCWSRKLEMVWRTGSRTMPCWINSKSAKLTCGGSARLILHLVGNQSISQHYNAIGMLSASKIAKTAAVYHRKTRKGRRYLDAQPTPVAGGKDRPDQTGDHWPRGGLAARPFDA